MPNDGLYRVIKHFHSLLLCTAMRAVVEILLESLAAAVAPDFPQIRAGSINFAGLIGNMTAALTLDKRLALANTQDG